MIVDTSIIIAILLKEPGYRDLYEKLVDAGTSRISAASYVETSMVLIGRQGDSIMTELNRLLVQLQVVPASVDVEQARLAVDAFRRYGKGRHRAGLNFGDCFSYALAKSTGEPLLFKGTDFGRTDVGVA
ncbi:MAG TPA: type II toxin-antitoxin system VapC family toxin [Acidobacteriaceae bacterium]